MSTAAWYGPASPESLIYIKANGHSTPAGRASHRGGDQKTAHARRRSFHIV
jgi:hypothetical protein